MPVVAAEPDVESPPQTGQDDLPVVYVAGPYSRPDPVENSHAVIKVADALLDAGIIPFVPHLTLLWHLVSPKPYHRWLDYDRHLLLRCDALLRVPRVSRLMALAIRFDRLLREGVVADQSELARLTHVTQPRMTQIMNLLHLAPDIQEQLLFLPRVTEGKDPVTEKMLRPIAAEIDWRKQRRMWREMHRYAPFDAS